MSHAKTKRNFYKIFLKIIPKTKTTRKNLINFMQSGRQWTSTMVCQEKKAFYFLINCFWHDQNETKFRFSSASNQNRLFNENHIFFRSFAKVSDVFKMRLVSLHKRQVSRCDALPMHRCESALNPGLHWQPPLNKSHEPSALQTYFGWAPDGGLALSTHRPTASWMDVNIGPTGVSGNQAKFVVYSSQTS